MKGTFPSNNEGLDLVKKERKIDGMSWKIAQRVKPKRTLTAFISKQPGADKIMESPKGGSYLQWSQKKRSAGTRKTTNLLFSGGKNSGQEIGSRGGGMAEWFRSGRRARRDTFHAWVYADRNRPKTKCSNKRGSSAREGATYRRSEEDISSGKKTNRS